MYAGRDFDPSDTGENEVYTFDFVNDLATNEAVQSAVWSCAVVTGTDNSATSRISGSATASGTKTSQRVTGLIPGVKYRLQALATTNLGNVRSLYAHVNCANPT